MSGHYSSAPAAQPLPIPTTSTRLRSTSAVSGLNGLSASLPAETWLDPAHIWYHAQFGLLALTLLYLFFHRIDLRSICAQYWAALPMTFKPSGMLVKAKLMMAGPRAAGLAELEPGSLEGKAVCVTGANGGVGFETVWHALVTGKAKRVYAGVRDEEMAQSVRNRLQERFQKDAATEGEDAGSDLMQRLSCLVMDHSSLASAYQAGQNLLAALEADGEEHLDAYVGTVGVAWLDKKPSPSASEKYESQDGIEWMVAVNAVNPLVILLSILPKMTSSDPAYSPRIVLHSSIAHTWCSLPVLSIGSRPRWISWNAILRDQTGRALMSRYGFSKLTQLHLLGALSSLIAPGKPENSVSPRLFAINPGEVDSSFPDRMLAWAASGSHLATALVWFLSTRVGVLCRRAFMLSSSEGAQAGLYALGCKVDAHAEQDWGYTYLTHPVVAGSKPVAATSPSLQARDAEGRAQCWNLARAKLYYFFQEQGEEEIAQLLTKPLEHKLHAMRT
ncbi:unnamed protein product [Parajaminaea phylloscopi]